MIDLCTDQAAGTIALPAVAVCTYAVLQQPLLHIVQGHTRHTTHLDRALQALAKGGVVLPHTIGIVFAAPLMGKCGLYTAVTDQAKVI